MGRTRSSKASLVWFNLRPVLDLGEVLRFTVEIQELWNYPFAYVDYYVARFFEDLQEHLPPVLEAVPGDIARVVSNSAWLARAASWREEGDDEEIDKKWDLYNSAIAWWHDREIDTGYLRNGPWFSFWRTDDDVHLRWATRCNDDRGTAVFLVPSGYFRVSSAAFQSAAFGFCEEVLSAMRQRVEGIQRDGWRRMDCKLDLDELIAEHRHRESRFAALRSQPSVTNWDQVRMHLDLLVERIGPLEAVASLKPPHYSPSRRNSGKYTQSNSQSAVLPE